MAGGSAGPMPTGTSGTQGQQFNTGSNWANPVQGNAWQNPTTNAAPYTGVGSIQNQTYKPPQDFGPYGNLNDPANAAGRRQQNVDLANQQPNTSVAQPQQNLGIGGYGYGPAYGGGGGFGGQGPMGGIAGLYGQMGMGPQRGFMDRALSGQTAPQAQPTPTNTPPTTHTIDSTMSDDFSRGSTGVGFGQAMNQFRQGGFGVGYGGGAPTSFGPSYGK